MVLSVCCVAPNRDKFHAPGQVKAWSPGIVQRLDLRKRNMIDTTGTIVLLSIPLLAALMVLIDDKNVQAAKKK